MTCLIDHFAENLCPINADIIFVLDSSGSVGDSNFQQVKTFTRAFANSLEIGPTRNQIGVILFGSNGFVAFHLNSHPNKTSLLNAIDTLQYTGGSTNTADALCLLLTEGFTVENGARLSAGDVYRLAVVMTDGMSNMFNNDCNYATTLDAAAAVHSFMPSILVFAIGVTNNVDNAELEAIASSIDNVVLLEDFNVDLFTQTMDEQTYDLCETSKNSMY